MIYGLVAKSGIVRPWLSKTKEGEFAGSKTKFENPAQSIFTIKAFINDK